LGPQEQVKGATISTADIHLRSGEAAIFGYGSLLSIASLERTLKQKYTGPFLPASLPGWRRTWDVRQPNRAYYSETEDGRLYPDNILYLNVTAHPDSVLNGIVCVVTLEQLFALDEREWMYDRPAVTKNVQDVRIIGGDVYLYVSRPEFVIRDVKSPRTAAIRATYLEMVESGLSGLGSSFRTAYEQSTDPVPQHLVIDDRLDSAGANTPAASKK
jgi:hypothetical protein